MPAIAKKGILYTEVPSVENRVVEGNQNPVTSGAVYKELGDTSVNNDLGANISKQIENLHGRLTQSEVDEQIKFNNTLPSGGFVCPSDGYIYAYNSTSEVTTGIAILDSKGKIITRIILNGRMGIPLYVRKGMIITDSKGIQNLPTVIVFTPFKA